MTLKEVDAFMQEYARELRRNPSLIMSKSSEIHQILRIYQVCLAVVRN